MEETLKENSTSSSSSRDDKAHISANNSNVDILNHNIDTSSSLNTQNDNQINNDNQQHPEQDADFAGLIEDDNRIDEDRIVKHIMVIGFHHKHGYQVDYCYPPLNPNEPVFSTPNKPISLPSCWKTLPLICLPDGSHNYDSDTIYFTMPDNVQPSSEAITSQLNYSINSHEQTELQKQQQQEHDNTNIRSNEGIKTIFGTACYRQIQADKLLNRTDDMTRVAVQKSVCVLSTKPLFGLIRSKLEMITHAYFDELDFSKVKILKLTYDNLNALLSRDSVKDSATFLGLSARHLVSNFGCNTLVLFKAILLEKKILFYKSPVRDLCSTIVSMCSLFTGLLECGGLDYSTCDLQLSPTLLEALKLLTPLKTTTNQQQDQLNDNCDESKESPTRNDKVFFSPSKEEVVIMSNIMTSFSDNNLHQSDLIIEDREKNQQNKQQQQDDLLEGFVDVSKTNLSKIPESELELTSDYEVISGSGNETGNSFEQVKSGEHSRFKENEMNVEDENDDHDDDDYFDASLADGSVVDDPYALKLCRLKPEECGLPLQIFTRGSFCLPYLSISYLDLLSDARVKSFVIGATNFLFKQRKEMYDVIVDMEENTIIINDANLKKCLALTTEDLRFMDYLSRHVKLSCGNQPRDEFDLISNDITKWVGGDEWIRYHFRLYILYLLKAAKQNIGQVCESFNNQFVQIWKQTTNNYNIWNSTSKASILDGLQSRHPFSSSAKGINFNDMKLKFSYAVNSSERGKLINQTLNGIGKWSIWNNIASAATAAATSAANAAANATTTAQQQPATTSQQQSSITDKVSHLKVQDNKEKDRNG